MKLNPLVTWLLLAFLAVGCEGEHDAPQIRPTGAPSSTPVPRAGGDASAPAWQERVKQLLFEAGKPSDIAEALRLVEKQARAGDSTAALWMGRSLLNEPPDRTGAAAWFLVAASSPETASDAQGELDSLALTPEELAAAEKEARALRSDLEKPPDLQP
jgi:hypothetical protein